MRYTLENICHTFLRLKLFHPDFLKTFKNRYEQPIEIFMNKIQ